MHIVTQIRNAARISARVSQDLAAAKTAHYDGGTPEQTIEWKAGMWVDDKAAKTGY